MTQKTPAQMADCQMVLATDLDGTFLGGTEADRDALYHWIRIHRATVGLVFVSGRDPAFIEDLCSDGRVPWPDFVVGDVGTTIAQIKDSKVAPITALEDQIAQVWGDRGAQVRAALDGHRGLALQPTPFRYRVSYDMDPATFDDRALQIVDDLGADVLMSDNRFFDVLPRGISKGPSLLRLVDHLSVAQTRVLAAGDTLNDLSMLIAGTPAVAVGGAEQKLLDALPDAAHIHRARAIGAAGIMEAVAHFNLHPAMERS